MNAFKLRLSICLFFLAGHLHSQVMKTDEFTSLKDSLLNPVKHSPHLDSTIRTDTLFQVIPKKPDPAENRWGTFSLENIKAQTWEGPDSLISKGAANILGQISGMPLPEKNGKQLPKHERAVQDKEQKPGPEFISSQEYINHISTKSNTFFQEVPLEEYKQKAGSYSDSFDRHQSRLDTVPAFDRARIDTMVMDYGTGMSEKIENELASQKELEELGQTNPIKASLVELKKESNELKAVDIQRLELKKIQKDHFPDNSKVGGGMAKMQKMKGKYRELKDSRLLKEGAAKRHSLKAYPIFARLESGLHLNIRSFEPFEGEAQPMIGYRLDKRWVIGVGPIFRMGRNNVTKLGGTGGPVSWAGYRSYALFRIKEAVFFQGEYQGRKHTASVDQVQQTYQPLVLAGIGTEFRLAGNFKVRSTVLYGFNKKQTLKAKPGSPWQVSMGITNYKNKR